MFINSDHDNKKLYYNKYLPKQYKQVMIILHGYAEYFDRYEPVIDFLNQNNIAVYGYDQRGHGDSDGQRAHIGSFKEYTDDLNQFIDFVYLETQIKPILYAHSMGSLVALRYLLDYDQKKLKAVISSGTLIKSVNATKTYLKILAKIISKFHPTFSVKLKFNTKATCSLSSVVDGAKADKKMFGVASARWGDELMINMKMVKSKLKQVDIPILFIHGKNDKINDRDATYEFYEMIECKNKNFFTYENSLHEVHFDVEREKFQTDLTSWLNTIKQ